MTKEETQKSNDNSFGIASVILGILSIILASGTGAGLALGIIGLIFSKKQKKKGKNSWSRAGFILNLIGIIIGITLIVLLVMFIANNPDFLAQLQGQVPNA